MDNATIEQAKASKAALENLVTTALTSFEEEYGVSINDIAIVEDEEGKLSVHITAGF